MRALLPVLVAASVAAATSSADVSIERWNGMLLVSAPASADLERLPQMAQRITLDARDMPIADVATFLRQATGMNIVVAPALLVTATPVTLQVRDMRLGNLLHWLERTARVHAGWVDGALYLSDRPVVGAQSTHLYDIRDLQLGIPDFPGPELALGDHSAQVAAAPTTAKPAYDTDALIVFLKKVISSN